MLVKSIVPITAGETRKKIHINPFDKHIGINVETLSSTDAITATPQETALNAHGIVHGGWTAAFLDIVASGVPYSYQEGALKDNEYGLTASLNIEFKRPVFVGTAYTGEGTIVKREGNNIQTKATITDDQGIQVATATALVKARRPDYSKQAA